jgi:RND family efflux transporter MFP subunit
MLRLFGFLGACCLAASTMLAEDAPAPAAPRSTIVLDKCIVRVIDKAFVSAERDGVVETVDTAIGEHVDKGQQLVHLRDEVAKSNLALAEAQAADDTEVRFGEVLKNATQEDFERAKALLKSKAYTAKDMTRITLEKDRGLFTIENAQVKQNIHKLEAELAAAQLKTFHIQAPFAGTVTRIQKNPGEAVTDGEPLLELINTDRVHIEGYARVEDAWKLQRGMSVTVQVDSPALENSGVKLPACEGKIVLVDVVVNPVTQTVRVVAEVANRENLLRDGLQARMSIDSSKKPAPITAAANVEK